MDIGGKQLSYLLAIYQLNQQPEAVGSAEIARTLKCSKASVSNMMTTLMNRGLLVKERYGKVYLTDTGYLLARDAWHCMEQLMARLPRLELDMTDAEAQQAALALMTVLPEHTLHRLKDDTKNGSR